jgi:hypothetical protein
MMNKLKAALGWLAYAMVRGMIARAGIYRELSPQERDYVKGNNRAFDTKEKK